MTLKVFIPTRHTHLPIQDLRRLVDPSIQIITGEELPSPADFEILISGFPDRDMILASPRLRAVIAPFAGAPKETIDLLADFPHITLHSIHFNVVPTAELAIGLMLAAAKFIIPMDQELRRNDWRSRYGKTPTTILAGRTATILGYGRIGRRVGSACRALDMQVVGVRRHVSPGEVSYEGDTPVHAPAALHTLLPATDVLFITLPLTAETDGMIGSRELALLPRHAILVNVGRGQVVDEAALYHALADQTLLAAGLDVWYHYPMHEQDRANTPPSRFPFHELSNVVMSPHRGGWLSAAENSRVTELAALLNIAAAGEPIPSGVDKKLGY